MPPEVDFRLYVIAFGAAGFVLSLVVEEFCVEYLLGKKLQSAKKVLSCAKYNCVRKEMDVDKKWPTLTAKVEDMDLEAPTPNKKPRVQMTVLRETNGSTSSSTSVEQ